MRLTLENRGGIVSWIACFAAAGLYCGQVYSQSPKGNLIPHSGFDTGVYRDWKSPYQSSSVIDNADLDAEEVHDGKYSLRLTTWEGGYSRRGPRAVAESTFKISLPKTPATYTLSGWVKCDRPLHFQLSAGSLAIGGDLNPEDGWRRLTATGELAGVLSLQLKARAAKSIPEELHGGRIWLDSIQLEPGDIATDWRAAGPELGLITTPPGNIFNSDEPVTVTARMVNPDADNVKVVLKTRLWDCFGKEFDVEDAVLDAGAGSETEKVFSFPSNRTGIYRLEVIATSDAPAWPKSGKRLEIPFYVLPKGDPNGWSPIGVYSAMNRPSMERMSRMGLYWNNLLSSAGEIVEWHKVYDRRKKEYLCDSYVSRLKLGKETYHMRYIACFGPSSILKRLPQELVSPEAIPGKTMSIRHAGRSETVAHIKLEEFRRYLHAVGRAYSPYFHKWQVVDECTFSNLDYLKVMVEAKRALAEVDPKAELIATYPQHTVYSHVRGPAGLVSGLYDLGRTAKAGRSAAEAARMIRDDLPIYFYDCSIPFSYLSETFNGWGKDACRAKAPAETPEQQAIYVANFKERLDTALSRQIHPLGAAGPNAEALMLYHVRMPGGKAACGFDAWGHPSPLLVACGIFNTLTSGGRSVGPIPLRDASVYVFSRGKDKGYLLAVRMLNEKTPLSIDLPDDVRQLDIWGNDMTQQTNGGGKPTATIAADMFSYLSVPNGKLDRVRALLVAAAGQVDTPAPEKVVEITDAPKPPGGLVLHHTMETLRDSTLQDTSGQGNHAPLENQAALVDSPMGKATVGGLTIPHSPSLQQVGGGLTISLWLRPDTEEARWTAFVKKDAPIADSRTSPTAYRPFVGYNLGTQGSSEPVSFKKNGFRFTIDGPGGRGEVVSGPISRYVQTGQWVHLVATYNPDPADRGLRLYVNGKIVADQVVVDLPLSINNTAPLTIGRDLTPFEGAIDNIQIYNHALTEKAIQKIWESESQGVPAS